MLTERSSDCSLPSFVKTIERVQYLPWDYCSVYKLALYSDVMQQRVTAPCDIIPAKQLHYAFF